MMAISVVVIFGLARASAQSLGPVVIPSPSVVPVYPELGTGVVVSVPQPIPPPYQPGTGYGNSNGSGGGSAMAAYTASGYSISGVAAAEQVGINPQAIAGIAYVESHDQNIGNANGSTSAFGVYQITQPTWQSTVAQFGLPYSTADMTNPTDQAVVASYILQDYANTVSQYTQGPPTVLQTYGAYMFGPVPGGEIATSPASTPLSNFVSPSALANNNMSGWTVGEYQSVMAGRLGGTANDSVFS
ncbi:MAG: transglycosylase SLT domain-containing protein [Acidiphilium sp.]|nr:transglycosylase SLT domain-containing protein [Acidiphilium sp.]MDD4937088.1 transglycosylase SLT domain-containing protein [Acidiphilium sp.]